jgi:ectoine hydrolase
VGNNYKSAIKGFRIMKTTRMHFDTNEYAARLSKTKQAMKDAEIDVLIVTDPSNMAWLTGYDGWSFYVHQCVVVSVENDLFWYGRGIDAPGAHLTTTLGEERIISYSDDFVQTPDCHPMDRLSEIIQDKGWGNKSIGTEMDNYYFSARAMASLTSHLPNATFIDATALVNWRRAVKSETEIKYMRRAARVIEKIYERILHIAEPGMRKNDLVAEIYHAGISGTEEYYGDYPAIVPLIGSGVEAAASHMTWNGERLEADSGSFLELAGAHNRYHCPISRTLYFGMPPTKYTDIEKVILDGIEATLPEFRSGNTCGEVANTFFKVLKNNGFEKTSRCGYPIGLSYPPDWGERTMSLRPQDTSVLKPGMTFHFMPGMWFDDWGFEMTESILVTDTGGECLANVPRQLFVK